MASQYLVLVWYILPIPIPLKNGDIGINDKCVRLSADDCSLYWITSPEDCLKL